MSTPRTASLQHALAGIESRLSAQLVASPRGSGISPRARRTSLESSAAAEDPVETFEDALGEEKMSAQELAELQEAAMQDQALHRFVASKVPLGRAFLFFFAGSGLCPIVGGGGGERD